MMNSYVVLGHVEFITDKEPNKHLQTSHIVLYIQLWKHPAQFHHGFSIFCNQVARVFSLRMLTSSYCEQ